MSISGHPSKDRFTTETEELRFRLRSLLAARRILDRKFEASRPSNRLRHHHLRRLRTYLKTSIMRVEQRLAELGVISPLPESAPTRDGPSPLPVPPRAFLEEKLSERRLAGG